MTGRSAKAIPEGTPYPGPGGVDVASLMQQTRGTSTPNGGRKLSRNSCLLQGPGGRSLSPEMSCFCPTSILWFLGGGNGDAVHGQEVSMSLSLSSHFQWQTGLAMLGLAGSDAHHQPHWTETKKVLLYGLMVEQDSMVLTATRRSSMTAYHSVF